MPLWITIDNEFVIKNQCSECKFDLPFGMMWKPNYCPNCGAKMQNSTKPEEVCPHCGGKLERRNNEYYCFGCHFWMEVDE